MKWCTTCFVLIALTKTASAHSWRAGEKPVFNEKLRADILHDWEQQQDGQKQSATPQLVAAGGTQQKHKAPPQAAPFISFAPKVEAKWDDHFLYIESNGMPAHNMMIGITAWQQQVPLPQPYYGENAWRIPLKPVPAKTPAPIENHFLRGAIAIAVNGIPIFNPQNNRGEFSTEVGELDRWGGHCGRADDYHYHTAPLHLQAMAGKGMPIAYALDGYPIYGLTEADGSPVSKLDECHGHDDVRIGYHYHASMKRPYVQSAFHGEVVEAGGQVDPQPRAQGVREALPPLRGAEITGFDSTSASSYKLSFTVNGDQRSVSYSVNADGTYGFDFENGREGQTKAVYRARRGRYDKRPSESESQDKEPAQTQEFVLTSPEAENGGNLPVDYTGDGSGATLPLKWEGAPAGTQSYALIMDHLAPGNEMKSYWVLWDIPANITSLPKNVKGVGKLGIGFKGAIGYEPPHSQGPGAKTYVLHVYALSDPPNIIAPPSGVTREMLLAAIGSKILAKADLSVVYTRGVAGGVTSQSRANGRDTQARSQGEQRRPWLQVHGAELDTNQDGVVTLDEMLADMKLAASKYDGNHDSIITPAEIDAAGEIREGAAFGGFIYRHAADLDANNDSRLTDEELAAAVKYIFNSADRDRDGKLTAEEVRNAPSAPFSKPPPRTADRKTK